MNQRLPGFRFYDLENKTLLITGVTRGIGRALLPGLYEQGLRLVLVSRGGGKMEALRSELGGDPSRIHLYDCDLSDPVAVERTGQKLVESGLQMDALLHNAAIDPRHRFETQPQAEWQKVFQVNLFSAVSLTRLLLPLLKKSEQGRILFTGSVMYELGGAFLTSYAATKGAVMGVTRALAHELKGSRVTVNCVVPGAIQVEKESGSEETNKKLIQWQSVPRRLVPGDLLGIISLLLSQAGSGITGQGITVDGGLLHALADPDGIQSAHFSD